MLAEKIQELENKISSLDNITGFQKLMKEHNKINGELLRCKAEVENLEGELTKELVVSAQNELTEEQFEKYVAEIKNFENFEKLPLDEQIKVYREMVHKISLCDNYLKSQKTEIIYVQS